MKTPKEIIQRAQLQLILSDRLVWENPYGGGQFHSCEEREEKKNDVSAWAIFHDLDSLMNENDQHLLTQTVDTVDAQIKSSRSFEFEAIESLLWTCGLHNKLTPATKPISADYHPLLVGAPLDELCNSAAMRSEVEISRQRDTYMLWYWRCKINQEFSSIKGNTVVDAISSAFSPLEVECAKQIKRCKGDFAVGRRPFSMLTDKEKYMIEQCMRWRYHALEWVLNDESWYDTSTDT